MLQLFVNLLKKSSAECNYNGSIIIVKKLYYTQLCGDEGSR